MECAFALGLDALFGLHASRPDLARHCQEAENAFVGLQSGVMDQLASLLCLPRQALMIDCRSLDTIPVTFDPEAEGLHILVCNTGRDASLGASGYNDRRVTCHRAAQTLGLQSLRDARSDDLAILQNGELKRTRHVVTENQRVLQAVQSLYQRDYATLGRLMVESHHSLRDDYEVSTPALDTFVDVALQAGAVGARVTGGGFGGSVVALVPHWLSSRLQKLVRAAFHDNGMARPEFYLLRPSHGARLH